MSTVKILALLVAAAMVAISVTNAIYFHRLNAAIKRNQAAARLAAYGPNSQSSSLALFVVNIIMAVIAGLLFMFILFKLVAKPMNGEVNEASAKASGGTKAVVAAAPMTNPVAMPPAAQPAPPCPAGCVHAQQRYAPPAAAPPSQYSTTPSPYAAAPQVVLSVGK